MERPLYPTISGYRILGPLGQRGGFGVVYRAVPEGETQHVALKLLQRRWRGRRHLDRFQREARTLHRLNHPHVCRLHDYGRDQLHDEWYIAMELCEGTSLRAWLAERDGTPATPTEVRAIAIPLASGLAAVHGAGVVHRDLKPANIMVGKAGKGSVKIIDFGLAKASDDQTVTQDGQQPGSPAYQSPEQLRCQDPDSRSDIWSVGVILYELLFGSRPFRNQEESRYLDPIPRLQDHGVPDEWIALVDHCLQKRPARRYLDGEELAAALRELAVGRTPSPPSAQDSRTSSTMKSPAEPESLPAFCVGHEPRGTVQDGALTGFGVLYQPIVALSVRDGSIRPSIHGLVALPQYRFYSERGDSRWERWPAADSELVRIGAPDSEYLRLDVRFWARTLRELTNATRPGSAEAGWRGTMLVPIAERSLRDRRALETIGNFADWAKGSVGSLVVELPVGLPARRSDELASWLQSNITRQFATRVAEGVDPSSLDTSLYDLVRVPESDLARWSNEDILRVNLDHGSELIVDEARDLRASHLRARLFTGLLPPINSRRIHEQGFELSRLRSRLAQLR